MALTCAKYAPQKPSNVLGWMVIQKDNTPAMLTRVSILISALFLVAIMSGCTSNNICNVSVASIKGTVFHDNHNHCAYPGLVTLPDGNLLAAFSCHSGTDESGNIVGPMIRTAVSLDNGANWQASTPVHFSDSTTMALSVLPNGKLFLSTSTAAAPRPGIPIYFMGTIGDGDQVSWSAPTYVHVQGWKNGCWAVSPLVQMANGNLLWPIWCYSNKTGSLPGSSMVLISADGGLTWPEQVVVGDASARDIDYDESAALMYPNSDVVMIIRHTANIDPYGSWFWTKSSDNGNSWRTPYPVAANQIVGRPTLALLRSGALVLMGRAQIDGSETTAFATSWDGGLAYSRFTPLRTGGTTNHDMYDAMSMRPDGTLGVVSVHGTPDEKTIDADYHVLVDSCPLEAPTGTP